ncbi:DUF4406 domain-containing protein [Lactococcus raffinolactis]|uniref:DUF7768 domain-containing protein n=1 Tax=Pseudolactococcus raffinolactis TaxID=1366 RepID=UPI0039AF8C31
MLREQVHKPLIYISSLSSSEMDVEKVREYCRFVISCDGIPIAPYLIFHQFLKEKTEHRFAMEMNFTLLEKCEEFWVFGEKLSEVMLQELINAELLHKKVHCFTDCCKEITCN